MDATPKAKPQPLPGKEAACPGTNTPFGFSATSPTSSSCSPELLIVAGGISQRAHDYLPNLKLRTPIVPAVLRNEAGIVGAAVEAAEVHQEIPSP